MIWVSSVYAIKKYARSFREEKKGERIRETQDSPSSCDFGCGIHQGFNPTMYERRS